MPYLVARMISMPFMAWQKEKEKIFKLQCVAKNMPQEAFIECLNGFQSELSATNCVKMRSFGH